MKNLFRAGLGILLFFVFNSALGAAEQITLAWDKVTDVRLAGYKLYYGLNQGGPYDGVGLDQGDSPIYIPLSALADIDNPQFILSGFTPGDDYYFVVTAYTDDMESDYSNEVDYVVDDPSIPADYEYVGAYACDSWEYGSGDFDYWDVQPVNPRGEFVAGENIMILAKAKNININYRVKIEIYKDGVYWWQGTSDWNDVGSGWQYGHYTVTIENTPAAAYMAKIYFDIGDGFVLKQSIDFNATAEQNFIYDGAYACDNFVYGSGDFDYWDVQPVNPRGEFVAGENIMILAKAKDIYVNHRWQIEIYKDGVYWWQGTSDWNDVGSGWQYGHYYVTISNCPAGDYVAKVYFDSGNGFGLWQEVSFTTGPEQDYIYVGAYTCEGIEPGSAPLSEWDYQPVNPKSEFSSSETAYILAKAKNVYINHQWKIEIYKDGVFWWEALSGWKDVGSGWEYTHYSVYMSDLPAAAYMAKIYFDDGGGYQQIDTVNFTAN